MYRSDMRTVGSIFRLSISTWGIPASDQSAKLTIVL